MGKTGNLSPVTLLDDDNDLVITVADLYNKTLNIFPAIMGST